jgi:hypothetical protein
MQGFRFHDLRHTFRTLGAHAGVPIEVMMAQIGHMDRETSLEYVHIQADALKRAQKLMDDQQMNLMMAVRKLPSNNSIAAGTSQRPLDEPASTAPDLPGNRC